MAGSTGRWPGFIARFRLVRPVLLACALGASLPLSAPVRAAGTETAMPDLTARAPADLRPFYAARAGRPLWLDESGHARPALDLLLRQVAEARIDSVRPSRLKIAALRRALDQAQEGDAGSAARIELAASRLFAGWVQALREAPAAPMTYESDALAPVAPTAASALAAAAASPSLEHYLAAMGWMHPFYAPLRAALLEWGRPAAERRRLALNLERVRALPANPAERYVLVDAAGARLWMMERGRAVDSMKVVVGKIDSQTPMMAGFIRYATLNPYWNVPDDLVQQKVARNALDKGPAYLKASGYQVLSGWEADAAPVDPASVDWAAVASGLVQVRVRQLPGGENFMGRVKFEFPNPLGIYLHDTPAKDLMLKDERQYSSGCIRLEDADRLGRWLMGKPLPRRVKGPEQRMDLPEPVPVYITYLTALPDPQGKSAAIAFQPDPYGRDHTGPSHFASALR